MAKHLKCNDSNCIDIIGFNRILEGMKRKQSLHIGDRMHMNIQFLDSLSLSFPGCKHAIQEAMDHHLNGFDLDHKKFGILERQRMFDGDRSHPRLVSLDLLSLTYPGWRKDVEEAERKHLNSIFCLEGVYDSYREYLQLLSRKQMMFKTGVDDASTVHPIQFEIIYKTWSYLGWEKDVQRVRNVCMHNFLLDEQLEKCQLRQMIHDNNISGHPALIQLSLLVLSYPGWESDIHQAKKDLGERGYATRKCSFDQVVQGMRNKQKIYNGIRYNESKREEGPISESTKNTNNFGNCAICLDAPRTHVFVPCGHMCACQECSSKVIHKQRKCPICKQNSTQAIQVFIA